MSIRSNDVPVNTHCPFCRMPADGRFLLLATCAICRDQLYDFVWVSAVQAVVAITFGLGTVFFLVEEILLFAVLVFVKHRIPPPWERRV